MTGRQTRPVTRRQVLRGSGGLLAGAAALTLAPELLSACATQKPSAGGGTSPGGSQTLSFAYQPGFSYGLFYVAQAKGWLKRAGVDLNPMTLFTDGSVQVDALLNNNFAASVQGFVPVLTAAAAGQPVKIIDVVDNSAQTYTILGKDSIDSVPALAGKTVGVSLGTNYDYFLVKALAKYGMTSSDVQVVNFPDPAKAQSAFIAGRLDAIVPITTNRQAILAQDKGARLVFSDTQFTQAPNPSSSPLAIYDLLVTTSGALASHKTALTSLMRVFHTQVRNYVASPATLPQAVDALYEWQTNVVKAQVTKAEIQTNIAEFDFYSPAEVRQIVAGGELKDSLTSVSEFLMSSKVLTKMPDVGGAIDSSLVSAIA